MKIEEGKYYRSEAGVKVGPMVPDGDGIYDGKGHCMILLSGDPTTTPQRYNNDGSVYNMRQGEESHRLVAEWHDDPTTDDYDTQTPDLTVKPVITAKYTPLFAVLIDAYEQASSGKGKERHANDRSFLEQPICEIGRMLGSVCDGELYQAIKKAQEASNMLARGEHKRAEAELLGAINYLAAAVILIRESEHGK